MAGLLCVVPHSLWKNRSLDSNLILPELMLTEQISGGSEDPFPEPGREYGDQIPVFSMVGDQALKRYHSRLYIIRAKALTSGTEFGGPWSDESFRHLYEGIFEWTVAEHRSHGIMNPGAEIQYRAELELSDRIFGCGRFPEVKHVQTHRPDN